MKQIKPPFRFSVGFKVAIAIGVILLIQLAIIINSRLGLSQIVEDRDQYIQANQTAYRILEIDQNIIGLQRNVLMFTYTGHSSSKQRAQQLYATIEAQLEHALTTLDGEDTRNGLTQMTSHLREYMNGFDSVVAEHAYRQELLEVQLPSIRKNAVGGINDLIRAVEINKDGSSQTPANVALESLLLAAITVNRFPDSPDSAHVTNAKQYLADSLRQIENLAEQLEDPDLRVRANQVVQAIHRYEASFLQLVQTTRGYLHLVNVVMAPQAAEFSRLFSEIKIKQLAMVSSLSDRMAHKADSIKATNTGISVLSILIGLIAVWLLGRNIVLPLNAITDSLTRLSQGEYETEIPCLHRRDEIGQMASAAQIFKDKAKRTEELLHQSKHLEHELRESENRFRTAFEKSPIGLALVGLDGKWLRVNEALCSIVGYDAQELTDIDFQAITCPEDLEADLTQVEAILNGKIQTYFIYKRYIHKNGHFVWVQLDVSLIRDPNGLPQYFISQIQDITARLKAEQELKQTNTELLQKNMEMEQFTYTVSHDLKSPLVSCIGLVDCIHEDLASGDLEQVRDSVARIQRNIGRMEKCINDLLELSRIGRIRHEPEWIDMNRLLAGLAEDLAPRIGAVGAVFQAEPNLPSLHADRVRIIEIFENLLSNALKYACTKPGIKITVGAVETDEHLQFFIRDTGPGIAEQYHTKIFGLFQRLEKKGEGSGVGLTIVARIMEIHGGKAWVESSKGKGATFWLAFPTKQDVASEEAA